ncbi:MAG: glycosyltransferase [Ilumatobacteraceae bacterium]
MSILTPVFDPPAPVLDACIASVLGQRSPNWEWCIVDDASTLPHVRARLGELPHQDERVRVHHRATNGGIVAATNDALAMATSSVVTFLDHDDELTEIAVEELLAAFVADPDLGIVYSDECLIDVAGETVFVYDKPDFSPERLRGHNYFCHLVGINREFCVASGGLSPQFEGAQDNDLVLRAVEHFGRAAHIPKRLYRWRAIKGSVAADPEAKPATLIGAERAVRAHCQRIGLKAGITPVTDVAFSFRLHRTTRGAPKVSILVRRVDGDLPAVVGEVLRDSQYSNVEIIGLDDDLPGPMAIDHAAGQAGGDVLLVVDGDVRLRGGNLIGELLPLAQITDVAAVGPNIYLPDGRVGANGMSFHGGPHAVGFGFDHDAVGAWGAMRVTREVSAVPALCFAARCDVFWQLGGVGDAPTAQLAGADYGRRALDAGWRILVTPFASVTVASHGSLAPLTEDDRTAWSSRWGAAGEVERYSLFDRSHLAPT